MKSWKVLVGAITAAAVLTLGGVGTVTAAPWNSPNWQVIEIECEPPLGTIDVLVGPGGPGFTADGGVAVPKRFEGVFDATIVVNGNVVAAFQEPFTEGARGHGFEGRLIECTGEITFEEEFTIRQREVRQLGLDPALRGETATFTGTGTFTVWVMLVRE